MKSNPIEAFKQEVASNISALGNDESLHRQSMDWLHASLKHKYSYNFSSLGRPIIQYPQDIVAMQEIIWKVKPDLIIETGIAHGGSIILSASVLALIDYCEAVEAGNKLDPKATSRRVLGIDIDIREHNRAAIQAHPMAHRIEMIQGSSVDPDTILKVYQFAKNYKNILVTLDSNHSHKHVLAELEAYAPLVTLGSYCVVFDTTVEDMPEGTFSDRPWGKGDNPKTALWEYLKKHKEFEIDKSIDHKLQITGCPDGFLKRI
ncbi:MAG: cephalosporin hydroxylase family protein [Candidatus Omnitrophota bacterium]